MTTAPHLLYVAWGYPPARSAGMYRALATANAFARAGWKVTVLTAPREAFERLTDTDPASEAAIDPSIDVVRVPFDLARSETDLSKWSRFRATSPLLWSWLRAQRDSMRFPEPGYGHWRPAIEAAAREAHRRHPVSLVIGSANPNVDFAPGAVLHADAGVPYVMDYRDTWHLNVYSGRRTAPATGRSSRLERRLLAGSSEAWFVNAPIRDWHAEQYPERAAEFHVVANGWDPEFLQLPAPRTPRTPPVFGYLGTVYGPMPLRETLDGWRIARLREPALADATFVIRGRLGHYANPDPEILAILAEYAEAGVRFDGAVSKTAVAEVYAGFDALVLVLGASHYVTSGKVFEYAATGLPVVSVHDPATAASTVLEGHSAWFPVDRVDAEDAARAFEEAARSLSARTAADVAATRAWADRYRRDEQLQPRIAALTELVRR